MNSRGTKRAKTTAITGSLARVLGCWTLLLAGALATGARRVVLKRPPSAAELPGPLAARHAGKLARYDVYHGEAP